MIFPNIQIEDVIQVGDKTRIDASTSYVSTGGSVIDTIEIQPSGSESFYLVPNTDKYLDWTYSTDAIETITLRITALDTTVFTITKDITVLSVDDDLLFSKDSDIIPYEDNILKYIRKGRNSFLDKHRVAQNDILKRLDEQNITKRDGLPLEKTDIYNIEEVKNWSKFLTLSYIFQSVSNAVDDVFERKAQLYMAKAKSAENMSRLRLDENDDDQPETRNVRSMLMVRG